MLEMGNAYNILAANLTGRDHSGWLLWIR